MAKKHKDFNQIAKAIVDQATGNTENVPKEDNGKNPAAVALGKLGGKKGGVARAAALTPEQRRLIATKAAQKRWNKKP